LNKIIFFFLLLFPKSNRLTITDLIVRILHHVHLIVLFLVGYHTTPTPSSTSSSTSSTNAGGSRIKHDYDNGSGRGNGANDSSSNAGHHQQQQQQQQSSPWSSVVKSESPHGLRGNIKNNFKRKKHFSFSLSDSYSTFTNQSFFPHNSHRFGGGAAGK
jgi:hypothetical protein